MTKSIKLRPQENILSIFYKAIETDSLHKIHLYHSDIHYIRAAIRERTGIEYSLEHIEGIVSVFNQNKPDS